MYLGVSTDDSLTFLTRMSKHGLIAVDAVGMLITQDVSVASQRQITLETRKVTCMPVVVHRLCVLRGEYQLQHKNTSATLHHLIITIINLTADAIFVFEWPTA